MGGPVTGSRRRAEGGATALEFGLVAPLMLLMIFGLIQYGYLFWALTTASADAREAARKLAVGQDWGTCVEPRMKDHAAQPAISPVVATYRWTDATGATLARPVQRGDYVEATVSFDTLDLSLPFIPVPGGGRVSESATRQVENVPDTAPPCDNPGTY
jgi:Flp pilus assembly protein TadG